jgi:hypothetical protein
MTSSSLPSYLDRNKITAYQESLQKNSLYTPNRLHPISNQLHYKSSLDSINKADINPAICMKIEYYDIRPESPRPFYISNYNERYQKDQKDQKDQKELIQKFPRPFQSKSDIDYSMSVLQYLSYESPRSQSPSVSLAGAPSRPQSPSVSLAGAPSRPQSPSVSLGAASPRTNTNAYIYTPRPPPTSPICAPFTRQNIDCKKREYNVNPTSSESTNLPIFYSPRTPRAEHSYAKMDAPQTPRNLYEKCRLLLKTATSKKSSLSSYSEPMFSDLTPSAKVDYYHTNFSDKITLKHADHPRNNFGTTPVLDQRYEKSRNIKLMNELPEKKNVWPKTCLRNSKPNIYQHTESVHVNKYLLSQKEGSQSACSILSPKMVRSKKKKVSWNLQENVFYYY